MKKISIIALLLSLTLAVSAQNNMMFKKAEAKLLSFDKKAPTTSPLKMKKVENYDKVNSLTDVPEYGILTGDDGSMWFYTARYTESEEFYYCYGAVDIDLYDGSSTKVTSIHYDVPAGQKVNYMELFGNVSSKFYDTNAKTKEVTLYVHEIGPDYKTIGHVIVFNTNGEQVKNYEIGNVVWVDASEKWNTYQRAIFVTEGQDEEGNTTTVMSVMKPASWNNSEPEVEHVFEVRDDLANYSNGPCMNPYVIDGEVYYVLSYYEKPFVAGYDDNYDIILTAENNFLIEIYNNKYEKVKSFAVPVTHPDDVYASTYAMGIYSYEDLTRGYYTGDGKFNVVVSRNDVRLDTDDDTYPYSFFVYDEDGNMVKTIAENVISWKQMQDIPGENDQMGCICLDDGVETLQMVNLPSCEPQVVFEANVGDRRISSNFDRYTANGTYQYAIGMGNATSNAQDDVIASIGWFTKDGQLDHYTNFNLGQNGEYFTPLIEGYTLNPSLFNTDSKREYIYIAKLRRTDGSDEIDNVLIVADENGEEIKRYMGQNDDVLRVAAVIDTEIGKPRMVVGFYNEEASTYSLDFYNLPFVKFAQGGDGTEENPYVIASAGDMWQISNEPKASYVLGEDIDMAEVAEPWTPVASFYGNINGNGKTVSNLFIESKDSYCGLFGYMNEGASLKDVTFENANINITEGNRYVGLVAGMTIKALVDSVYVKGYNVTADEGANAEFGGFIGQATYFTELNSDGITGAVYDVPGCSIVGGLAGDTRTSTNINGCLFSGSINARSNVGGIVGGTGKDCKVNNCHVDASLKANSGVGGVVGDASRSLVSNNVVEGSIEVESGVAGGVLGSIESDWKEGEDKYITGNVVALESITAPEDAKAVHRIVGFSIADEQYEEGETVLYDKGFDKNYASPVLQAYGAKEGDMVDGADYESLSREFLESLGFSYGDNALAPWADTDTPMLYFEKIWADGIETIPASATNSHVGLKGIYNLNGQRVNDNATGIVIKDGKKILRK